MSGWDANWDSTQAKDKLPRNVLTQLRAALVERWQATNYTDAQITANLPAAPEADKLLHPGTGLPTYTWFQDFQAYMTAALGNYANHVLIAANGGTVDGLTSAPVWTEAAMLTAIGDAARIPAPSSNSPAKARGLVAAWAYQQYRMLNLLRWKWWTPGVPQTLADNLASAIYGDRTPLRVATNQAAGKTLNFTGKTFAEMVALIGAASWSDYSYGQQYAPYLGLGCGSGESGYIVSWTAGNQWSTQYGGFYVLKRHTFEFERNPTALFGSPAIQFVAESKVHTSTPQPAYWESTPYSVAGELRQVYAMAAGDANIETVFPPTDWSDLSTLTDHTGSDGPRAVQFSLGAIVKYDGGDGFAYGDW
jgi:hypothetical protein